MCPGDAREEIGCCRLDAIRLMNHRLIVGTDGGGRSGLTQDVPKVRNHVYAAMQASLRQLLERAEYRHPGGVSPLPGCAC